MSEHRHTNECLAYAAKTGKAFCIAECKDSGEAIEREYAALKRENEKYLLGIKKLMGEQEGVPKGWIMAKVDALLTAEEQE